MGDALESVRRDFTEYKRRQELKLARAVEAQAAYADDLEAARYERDRSAQARAPELPVSGSGCSQRPVVCDGEWGGEQHALRHALDELSSHRAGPPQHV